jgi:urea carboxylase system permease
MSVDQTGERELNTKHGYRQRLDRSIGQFAAFAAGVSFVSILTGISLMFAIGYGTSGPVYWWTWLFVFGGQLTVALVFAELATRFPIAGSVYQWAKTIGGRPVGWIAGWLILGGTVAACASVALAAQPVLTSISSGFQFVGDGSGELDIPVNSVILGAALIVFALVANNLGVRVLTRINSTGVIIELVAAVLLVVLFFAGLQRGPEVVFDDAGHIDATGLGWMGALLLAAFASLYTIVGFDTAGSLGEETRNPRKNSPRAIVRAVIASGVIGAFLILGAIMSVKDLGAEELSTVGLPYVVTDVLGPTLGSVFLWAILIAVTVCVMAAMAQGTRMMFSMARDRALPFSGNLAALSKRNSTPLLPNFIVAILAIALLVINIQQPQLILIVTSMAVALYYLAYLLVTGSVLLQRFRGTWPPKDGGRKEGYYSLGRWGIVVNILAVLYGASMAVNLIWPREVIYNPTPPFAWYFQFGGLLFLAIFLGLGVAYYAVYARMRTGVLAGHEADGGDEAQ